MSESYLEIQLDQQPIELCKLLKIADLVAGGGEAKVVISEGYVLLNGEVEYQKRKKVYHNDIVEFNGEVIQVIVDENLNYNDSPETDVNDFTKETSLAEQPQQKQYSHNNQNAYKPKNNELKKNKQKKAAPTNEGTAQQNKRRPISF